MSLTQHQHHTDKHPTRHLTVHVEGTSSTFISTPNPHSHFQAALTFEIIELEAEVVNSETIFVCTIFRLRKLCMHTVVGAEDSYLTAR